MEVSAHFFAFFNFWGVPKNRVLIICCEGIGTVVLIKPVVRRVS